VSYITELKQKSSKGGVTEEHTEVKLMCCSVPHTHVRFDTTLYMILSAKIIRILCAKNYWLQFF